MRQQQGIQIPVNPLRRRHKSLVHLFNVDFPGQLATHYLPSVGWADRDEGEVAVNGKKTG